MDWVSSGGCLSTQSVKLRSLRNWTPFFVKIGIFVIIVVLGYMGFRAFASQSDLTKFNLYALAIVAAVASFFSPCAFPLLPSYFSFYHQVLGEGEIVTKDKYSGIKLASAASLGVITFNLLLGLIISVLGIGFAQSLSISSPTPSEFVGAARGVVGVILILLGVGQWFGWNLKPSFVDAFSYRFRPKREGDRQPFVVLFLYGFGYNAAGMGCTGPIIAGLMIMALSTGSFYTAISAFAVFSLTMGILMFTISNLIAASRQSLVTQLRIASPKIKRASSILLVIIGFFNVFTTLNSVLFLNLLFPNS